MVTPKASYNVKLDDGRILFVSFFPTKNDPKAEVMSIRIREKNGDEWENYAKVGIYRSPEGEYRLLPDQDNEK